ncbi:MAG: signal peptidase I [bacterium]|nr:signal peptidase I [bacterium]
MDNTWYSLGTLIYLIAVVGVWKVFTKAGKPGWLSIIPILNLFIIVDIAGKPLWWFLLFLIPGVNVIILFIVYIALARKFGQTAIFGFGLVFLPIIFWPLLGFGEFRYRK